MRRCGWRQGRYLGWAKTRLQHILTAIAINLVRLEDWWCNLPSAKTRADLALPGCSRWPRSGATSTNSPTVSMLVWGADKQPMQMVSCVRTRVASPGSDWDAEE